MLHIQNSILLGDFCHGDSGIENLEVPQSLTYRSTWGRGLRGHIPAAGFPLIHRAAAPSATH